MSGIIKTYEKFHEFDPYGEEKWEEDEELIETIHDKLKVALNAWMPALVTMRFDGDYVYIRYIETRKYYHIWPKFDQNGKVKGVEVTEFELGKRENVTEFNKNEIDECVKYITDTIVKETEKTIR